GGAARRDADGVTARPVPATTPFHSPAMEPAVAAAERAHGAAARPAAFPVRSGYTTRLLTSEQAASARFWARQIVDTVQFGPALTALLDGGDRLLVECGPGRTLSAFALRQRAVRTGGSGVLSLLPGDVADHSATLTVAAALWCEGHDVGAAADLRPSGAPAVLGASGRRFQKGPEQLRPYRSEPELFRALLGRRRSENP
ncbi:MAG: hypothetical protein LH603_17125, partial [Pseudonocardia sp.]|nr:hypothetical protein [Pseudonocardia sp.]